MGLGLELVGYERLFKWNVERSKPFTRSIYLNVIFLENYEEQLLDCKGTWWLPENPKEQRTGTLHFSPDEGGELSLIGDFGETDLVGKVTKRFNIILGVSEGKEFTLYGCQQSSMKAYATEVLQTESVYVIGQILVGQHFPKSDEIKFNRMIISFSYLNEWVGYPESR